MTQEILNMPWVEVVRVWKQRQANAAAKGEPYYTTLVDPRTDRVLAKFTPEEVGA